MSSHEQLIYATPAAAKWVKTPLDAMRYLQENASKIPVSMRNPHGPLGYSHHYLSDLPPPLRQMYEVRFLDRFRKSGWLPCTTDDICAASAEAVEGSKP